MLGASLQYPPTTAFVHVKPRGTENKKQWLGGWWWFPHIKRFVNGPKFGSIGFRRIALCFGFASNRLESKSRGPEGDQSSLMPGCRRDIGVTPHGFLN